MSGAIIQTDMKPISFEPVYGTPLDAADAAARYAVALHACNLRVTALGVDQRHCYRWVAHWSINPDHGLVPIPDDMNWGVVEACDLSELLINAVQATLRGGVTHESPASDRIEGGSQFFGTAGTPQAHEAAAALVEDIFDKHYMEIIVLTRIILDGGDWRAALDEIPVRGKTVYLLLQAAADISRDN